MTSADWTEDQIRADLAPALEIVRPLGQGSLSNDFVAREVALKRLVSIKVLRREFADEQKSRLRFEREAQAAARISHNHVATVFWVGCCLPPLVRRRQRSIPTGVAHEVDDLGDSFHPVLEGTRICERANRALGKIVSGGR